jgi:quercetin dioxygenase-like cupin family protein
MPRRGIHRRVSEADPASGSVDDLPPDEPWRGVRRRAFDSQRATATQYEFGAGAEFPLHSHPQEQITPIEEGDLELTVGDTVERLGAGDWSVGPPEVPHGISAGAEGARFLAIVVPRRTSPHAYTVIDTDRR